MLPLLLIRIYLLNAFICLAYTYTSRHPNSYICVCVGCVVLSYIIHVVAPVVHSMIIDELINHHVQFCKRIYTKIRYHFMNHHNAYLFYRFSYVKAATKAAALRSKASNKKPGSHYLTYTSIPVYLYTIL